MAETTSAPAVKIEPGTEADAEDKAKRQCLHQVEFYFADSNLPYDRFMWELHTKKDADHWISIATIADFKRMRGYRDTYGLPWVVTVLRGSETLLEVDSKGEHVRRKTVVKEPVDQWDRTAYVKGFGPESEAGQAELEEFLKEFGAINAVRMRRNDQTKEFKGSVFVEFTDVAGMKRFLALDPKPRWKDAELVTMTKEEYCVMKIKEKGLPDSALNNMRKVNAHTRKGFNAFRDNKGRQRPESVSKVPVFFNFMGKQLRAYRLGEDAPTGTKPKVEEWEFAKKTDIPHVKGATLLVSGFGPTLQFRDIKGPLEELEITPSPFIMYQHGDTRALLLFNEPVTDETVDRIRNKITSLNNLTVEWTRLDDSEEHALQQDRANALAQRALGAEADPKRHQKQQPGKRGQQRGGRNVKPNDRNSERKAAEKKGASTSASAAEGAVNAGEDGPAGGAVTSNGKRKRTEVEPDGGSTQGVRGAGVPSVGTAPKKVKVEVKTEDDSVMADNDS